MFWTYILQQPVCLWYESRCRSVEDKEVGTMKWKTAAAVMRQPLRSGWAQFDAKHQTAAIPQQVVIECADQWPWVRLNGWRPCLPWMFRDHCYTIGIMKIRDEGVNHVAPALCMTVAIEENVRRVVEGDGRGVMETVLIMMGVLTSERVSWVLMNGEMCRMKFDGCRGHLWAGKMSPSLGGAHGKSVDGHRGHWWTRKTSPSGGEACGKGVDGSGGHWWVEEISPSSICNGVVCGMKFDGCHGWGRCCWAVVRHMRRVLMVVEDVGGQERSRWALLIMVSCVGRMLMGVGRQGRHSQALLMRVRCMRRTPLSAVNNDEHCGQVTWHWWLWWIPGGPSTGKWLKDLEEIRLEVQDYAQI